MNPDWHMRVCLLAFACVQFMFVSRSHGASTNLMDTWEAPQIVLTQVAGANCPVWIANAGDGSGRLFIVEQSGAINIASNEATFLNLTPTGFATVVGSGGATPQVQMVSVAFPPNYASKGYFYVSYYDWTDTFKVSRFNVSTNNPDAADPNSEVIIGSNYRLGCHGGQIVFAPDGTLYLNLAGPIANAKLANWTNDLDILSGKMLALLNENGQPLLATLETYWPFRQHFDATDCAEIGGEFATNSTSRMNGVYFYGDNHGAIWGLRHQGTNWAQYHLANPTFAYSPDGIDIILPTNTIPTGGFTLTNTPPPNNPPPGTGPITPITEGNVSLLASSSIKVNIPAPIATGQTLPVAPFIISAFGRDEVGNLYVANYGAGVWYQSPPNFTSTEKFVGGGVYMIQDNPLQFSVHERVAGDQVVLEWQSTLGIQYHIQSSTDLIDWSDIQPAMTGDNTVFSISTHPNNPEAFYRVIAMPPTP